MSERTEFIEENAASLLAQRDAKLEQQRKRLAYLQQSNETYRERDATFRALLRRALPFLTQSSSLAEEIRRMLSDRERGA